MGRVARRTRSLGWRRWSLLGLVLASTLLGHDLVMAAQTPAATSTDVPLLESFVHAHPHGTETVGEEPDDAPTPDHPDGCGVARPAASPSGDPDLAGPAMDGFPRPALAVRRASPREGGRVEPTWPPGTRRALLQVYRI